MSGDMVDPMRLTFKGFAVVVDIHNIKVAIALSGSKMASITSLYLIVPLPPQLFL